MSGGQTAVLEVKSTECRRTAWGAPSRWWDVGAPHWNLQGKILRHCRKWFVKQMCKTPRLVGGRGSRCSPGRWWTPPPTPQRSSPFPFNPGRATRRSLQGQEDGHPHGPGPAGGGPPSPAPAAPPPAPSPPAPSPPAPAPPSPVPWPPPLAAPSPAAPSPSAPAAPAGGQGGPVGVGVEGTGGIEMVCLPKRWYGQNDQNWG